jgi:hypothetical protein
MRRHPTPTRVPEGSSSISGDPQGFEGISHDYMSANVERLSGSLRIRHTLAEMGAAVAPAADTALRANARRDDWEPGSAAGDLPVRLAGGCGRQHCATDVSGSIALSCCFGARGLAFAPYSDLLWWETSEPDLG